MTLQPVERRSASAAVFDQLVAEVLSGTLAPGDPLPAERSLTGVLAVNRQAVREALQRLAQAGLVEINHGGPTKVLDYRRNGGLDLLPMLVVREGGFDGEVVRSVMEMRACIGPDVARLAAERASEYVIGALADVVSQMASATDSATLARLDLDLWDLLVDGSANIAYRLSFNSLRQVYEPVLELLLPVFEGELRNIAARRQIATAVRERDGAAARSAASQLLHAGTDAMTAVIRGLESEGN